MLGPTRSGSPGRAQSSPQKQKTATGEGTAEQTAALVKLAPAKPRLRPGRMIPPAGEGETKSPSSMRTPQRGTTTQPPKPTMRALDIASGAPMKPSTAKALGIRIDAMAIALSEIARALPPTDAPRVAQAISTRVGQLLADRSVGERADESIAADLATLLTALHRGGPSGEAQVRRPSPQRQQ